MRKISLFLLLLVSSTSMRIDAAISQSRVLDDFDQPSAWKVSASDDVQASLRSIAGEDDKALCLDYDLHGTAGYASIRRALSLNFPDNYAFDLRVRGDAPANTLQFKLIDASGDNVWWHQWPNYSLPHRWTDLRIDKDALDFAWGPRKDHALEQSASLELTVAAGKGGGRGSVCFDRLEWRELPPSPTAQTTQTPTLATDPNAYVENIAKRAPRGFYPRGFFGEQSYWTVVGVDGGSDSGLLSEDGALEIGKGGFSIEPFLIADGKPISWADADISHSLRDGYLPIPSLLWKHGALSLRITAFGAGTRAQSQLIARYEVRNDGARPRDVTLALAVRPFQVDPPTQFLNAVGGVSPIHDLEWKGRTLFVDGRQRAVLLRQPDAVGTTSLASGSIVQQLVPDHFPSMLRIHDSAGFASGAALYHVHLPPHASETIGLIAPLSGSMPVMNANDARARLNREEKTVAAQWRAKLNRVSLQLPSSAQRLADSLRSSLAWILISRDGPELRPGTRSYARSWIRDGAMMADSLLRLGDTDAARDYALWYAPHQFSTGKVPCCVDVRGADPTPENDSSGELLHLIAQVYRYTHDRTFLQTLWPHVAATTAYLQKQRMSERDSPTPMFRGMLPASISHEGYSEKPVHSYWDDFWALIGYKGAVTIAQALGKKDDTRELAQQRDQFRDDLYESIRASVAAHHIDYIPGSAELGDFDPTATTIALTPGGEMANLRHDLPPSLLHDTFERYWSESMARAKGNKNWDAYAPRSESGYEWRNVGAFTRLGWRSRIPALVDFLFDGQRPTGWNEWAEVVAEDARKQRFIGDMPHGWVASDYIRSVLDLFAYERDSDHAIVLDAGVQPAWLHDSGIALHGLRTPYGELGYTLKREGSRVVWRIDAGTRAPGGLVLTWPLRGAPGRTTLNGKVVPWSNGELHVHALPARVIIETAAAPVLTQSH
ncbi:MAG: discoidin domain-containing protein [Rhodanobacteraceae bacterium]